MYRLFAAMVICAALIFMAPSTADAHGGCRYGGYSYGYYPRAVGYYPRPAYYGPRYPAYGYRGFYGPSVGFGYGRGGYYRGGGSFVSFGFGF